MSALLKAGNAAAQSLVRPLGPLAPEKDVSPLALPALAGVSITLEPSRFERERMELEAAIDDLTRRLTEAEEEADVREDAAFERGRRQGEDLATGETEKRLDLLRKGLEAVQLTHSDRMTEYELLALQLARTALRRVFGDEELQAELVTETLAHRLAATKHELVLGIRVSPRDFRSKEELGILAERFPGVEIAQDEALDAGGCVVGLRLGSIDLGLPGQWQKLDAFFEQLGRPERAE